MGSQAGRGIAGDDWVQLNCIGAQDGLIVDSKSRTRDRHVAHVQVEVSVLVVGPAEGQISAALDLGDS